MKTLRLLFGTGLALLSTGCGGNSSTSSGVSIFERSFHDSGETQANGMDLVVLTLEPAVGVDNHTGDIGSRGSDSVMLIPENSGEHLFSLQPANEASFRVQIRSTAGELLGELNSQTPELVLDIQEHEYEASVIHENRSTDTFPVFIQDGSTFSRNCIGCSLQRANFTGLNLVGIDLSGSDLREANFSFANCSRTNFSDANLEKSMLSGANCANANFSGANLVGAGILGTDLRDALIEEAIADETTISAAVARNAVKVDENNHPQLERQIYTSIFPTQESVQAQDNVTIRASTPLILGYSDGSPMNASYGQVSFESGAVIKIISPTTLMANSFSPVGGGSEGTLTIQVSSAPGTTGAAGTAGKAGSNGTSRAQQGGNGGTGGQGKSGTDGFDLPSVAIHVGDLKGTISVSRQPGHGGSGGAGGAGGAGGIAYGAFSFSHPGGNGGNGGTGGQGGIGGSLGNMHIYYSNMDEGHIVEDSGTVAKGGAGGAGGVGGSPGFGKPNGQLGRPGAIGTNGQMGGSGTFAVVLDE